jgi:S-formylglutathione hydrolase
MEPGIEPAYAWKDVKPEDRFYRKDELMQERFGTPIDADYWAANNPATIARDNADALRKSGLAIFIDVGTEDVFGLDRGAEFLHRTLYDRGVPHEFRYVLGADHVGKSISPRIRNGLDFLNRYENPPGRDVLLNTTRRVINRMKKRAGVAD